MTVLVASCRRGEPQGPAQSPAASVVTSAPVRGDYALGPVEFHGAEHNACGPFLAATERLYGADLIGVGRQYGGHAELCDACVEVETRVGTRVLGRVITYGDTVEPGDVDLSAHAFATLLRPDPSAPPERPRPMQWRVVACPGAASIAIQFQTEAHEGWTAFWIRNPRWPVVRVEARSQRHPTFVPLRRETDGTFVADDGLGRGRFTVRLHAAQSAPLEISVDGVAPGALVDTRRQLE